MFTSNAQVAILNASSIFGRTVLNAFAADVGLFNLLLPVNAIMGILVFAMFGVTNTGAVIVFCILYGFFTGACTFLLWGTSPSLAHVVIA